MMMMRLVQIRVKHEKFGIILKSKLLFVLFVRVLSQGRGLRRTLAVFHPEKTQKTFRLSHGMEFCVCGVGFRLRLIWESKTRNWKEQKQQRIS
jgi:hypothetical protein